jgi:hypothetical protein
MGDHKIAAWNLHRDMGRATCLTHRLEQFGHTPTISRMIAAQPAAIRIEGQLTNSQNQVAVCHELAALSAAAESDILNLHQNRYREAVIERCVFYVLYGDTRFFEGTGGGEPTGRVSKVNPSAV